MSEEQRIEWPDGRRFAFTIFDDTDRTDLDTGPTVYRLLDSLGLRTTKSVWPVAPTRRRHVGGGTCADPDYLAWCHELQTAGFEIGYHNATDHSSTRAETLAALVRFNEMFGHWPRVGADHAGNLEALYAGAERVSGASRVAYRAIQAVARPGRPRFSGADETSEFFWGDLCRQHITYWRGLSFAKLDAFRVCPDVPFHDPRRPYVNQWFVAADAPDTARLVRLLSERHLDELERTRGLCIVYAHLGVETTTAGRVRDDLARALERVAERRPWTAGVSEILDHVRDQRGERTLDDRERARLERRWIVDRIRNSPLVHGPRRASMVYPD